MKELFSRREFVIFGSTVASSLLLKACGTAPSTNSRPKVSPAVENTFGETIKVGILHSLSGSLAISEKSVVDAERLAIEEINQAGGVLGRQIEAIVEDGNSDPATFADKAKKLIEQDKVVTVFGCWTSASRKAVLPIFESNRHLLWYPVQYEGQECSSNIFYMGAAPNQQIEPSVAWLLQHKGKEFFLVGSDYVFPRTANAIVKAQLQAEGGKSVGEEYIPLGSIEVKSTIAKIKQALPNGGVIYNTLNGDTNIAFFRELKAAGLHADRYPSMSVSIAEEEVKVIGIDYLLGHYAAWNYFQTVETPVSTNFVQAFKSKYGSDRVVSDPMEAGYIMVYFWKQAVEKAETADQIEKIKAAAYGLSFDAPEGRVTLNVNHHLSKFVRIGEVKDNGLFQIVYETKDVVKPVPWSQSIAETKGYTCDWLNPSGGGKYRAS